MALRRSAPVDRPFSTDAGRSLEPAPAAVPEQTKKVRMTRQTLDLPAEQYDELHDQVRVYAREHGLTSRDFNAQRVLRALVGRMLADDQLAAEVFSSSAGT